MDLQIFYATNRAHEGPEQFRPTGYGTLFSTDGMENLRFGRVNFSADDAQVADYLNRTRAPVGQGDGEGLQDYLAKCVTASQRIVAYPESIPSTAVAETAQKDVKLGSLAMFADLQADMQQSRDMLVFIHGFNVSWAEAVGSAAALEAMLNRQGTSAGQRAVRVVLFTWPSNGKALPFVSYKSDRSDAQGSAGAVGRGFLKVRDFLHELGRQARQDNVRVKQLEAELNQQGMRPSEIERAVSQLESTELCGQKIHLLCHSMGNYLLENALQRLYEFTPGSALPRLFDQVLLCAPDVDDDVLETSKPMERVHQIANRVTIYHNANDSALRVSDYTKGNPDRLGQRGAARLAMVHQKVQQVDCHAIVAGLTQHSYYANGVVNADIVKNLQGLTAGSTDRPLASAGGPNAWRFEAPA
jgi:esterase/lipase superfamily enzyme